MWSILFIAAIGQGLFFLILLLLSKKYRSLTSGYLCVLLSLFLITNLDYYFIASGYYKVFPWFFGISNGLILLMGPTLYFYLRSLLMNERVKLKDLIHTIPYAIFILLSFPLLTLPYAERQFFISAFVNGDLPLRSMDYIIFVIQVVHLCIYLILIARTVKLNRKNGLHEYASWVRALVGFLCGYGVLVLLLVAAVFVTGKFSLTINYCYSIACSILLYLVTGFALLNPNISFEVKKRNRKPLDNKEVDPHWYKLIALMEKDKIFVNAEMRLQDVAGMVDLTPHQLSQLINERSGKNFSDFLNHYRVEEFKLRIVQPESDHLTLIGLALEIGFNSKTSFNNTFKKFTGLTPSEYKRKIQ